jgi:prolipoprotein diacylglyceryl transferase
MNFLGYVNWNISPEIFSFGFLTLRWYGILFATGFVVGYRIMEWVFKNENIDLKILDSLTMTMVLSTVIGARLGHCLFYSPEYYLLNPIEILKVWEGGLASHGAGVGIIIGLYIFTKKFPHIKLLWILDRIVITIALAGMFIRLGNLMNSEIFGLETNLPWAFVFQNIDDLPRHPTQIYEAFSYLLVFIFLIFKYAKEKVNTKNGELFGLFLIGIFGARFIVEYFKENQVPFEDILPINMGQILSIPFVLVGIYFAFLKKN